MADIQYEGGAKIALNPKSQIPTHVTFKDMNDIVLWINGKQENLTAAQLEVVNALAFTQALKTKYDGYESIINGKQSTLTTSQLAVVNANPFLDADKTKLDGIDLTKYYLKTEVYSKTEADTKFELKGTNNSDPLKQFTDGLDADQKVLVRSLKGENGILTIQTEDNGAAINFGDLFGFNKVHLDKTGFIVTEFNNAKEAVRWDKIATTDQIDESIGKYPSFTSLTTGKQVFDIVEQNKFYELADPANPNSYGIFTVKTKDATTALLEGSIGDGQSIRPVKTTVTSTQTTPYILETLNSESGDALKAKDVVNLEFGDKRYAGIDYASVKDLTSLTTQDELYNAINPTTNGVDVPKGYLIKIGGHTGLVGSTIIRSTTLIEFTFVSMASATIIQNIIVCRKGETAHPTISLPRFRVGTPIHDDDATPKKYVDDANALKQDKLSDAQLAILNAEAFTTAYKNQVDQNKALLNGFAPIVQQHKTDIAANKTGVTTNKASIHNLEQRGTYRGTYATLAAAEAAVPNPNNGDFVAIGITDPYQEYIYSVANTAWEQAGIHQGTGKATFGDGTAVSEQTAAGNSKSEQKIIDDAQDAKIKAAEDGLAKKVNVSQDERGVSENLTAGVTTEIKYNIKTDKLALYQVEIIAHGVSEFQANTHGRKLTVPDDELIISIEVNHSYATGNGDYSSRGGSNGTNSWFVQYGGGSKAILTRTGNHFDFTPAGGNTGNYTFMSFSILTKKYTHLYDLNETLGGNN